MSVQCYVRTMLCPYIHGDRLCGAIALYCYCYTEKVQCDRRAVRVRSPILGFSRSSSHFNGLSTMKTISIELPATVFSALRQAPDEFVQEIVLFKSKQAEILPQLFEKIC